MVNSWKGRKSLFNYTAADAMPKFKLRRMTQALSGLTGFHRFSNSKVVPDKESNSYVMTNEDLHQKNFMKSVAKRFSASGLNVPIVPPSAMADGRLYTSDGRFFTVNPEVSSGVQWIFFYIIQYSCSGGISKEMGHLHVICVVLDCNIHTSRNWIPRKVCFRWVCRLVRRAHF